ncbi:hypothetical protein AB6C66_03915 [Vibrio splendidus]|uniref:hypothetical protein n=1 Tax=Vibrio splendidus TaxID=29497 RepID=UPI0003129890|nr:hypothetical protein [Vibrio splendidus]PTP72314.1 hypothetical protein CWO23_07970 [Vibrio splendidus]
MKHLPYSRKSTHFESLISIWLPPLSNLNFQLHFPKSVSDFLSLILKAQPQNTTSLSVISSGDS